MFVSFIFLFVSLWIPLSTSDEKQFMRDWDFLIDEINEGPYTWSAGKNFPSDTPLWKISKLLGTKRGAPLKHLKNIKVTRPVKDYDDDDDDVDIPESFDARETWPGCPSIGRISDQSACASGWVVAPTDAINDRLCISSNSQNQQKISSSYIMSCCTQCSPGGCSDGWSIMAYGFWVRWGVPTGGAFGSNEGCKNYPFESCDHYESGGSRPACPDEIYEAPRCTLTCDDPALNLNDTLNFGEDAYFLDWFEESIQKEILKNGSVTADMDVYSDFLYYKSGVYKHAHGHLEGTQTVRLIGWGVERNETDPESNVTTNYWIGANSWNEDWGDQGFFKIIRGSDNCGIESAVTVGIPRV